MGGRGHYEHWPQHYCHRQPCPDRSPPVHSLAANQASTPQRSQAGVLITQPSGGRRRRWWLLRGRGRRPSWLPSSAWPSSAAPDWSAPTVLQTRMMTAHHVAADDGRGARAWGVTVAWGGVACSRGGPLRDSTRNRGFLASAEWLRQHATTKRRPKKSGRMRKRSRWLAAWRRAASTMRCSRPATGRRDCRISARSARSRARPGCVMPSPTSPACPLA